MIEHIKQRWAAYLMAIAASVTAGCAGMQQAIDAYGSVAVSNARAANDTLIEAYKVGMCGLPLSAIARHPEIVPAIRALCLQPGEKASDDMLESIEKSR